MEDLKIKQLICKKCKNEKHIVTSSQLMRVVVVCGECGEVLLQIPKQ